MCQLSDRDVRVRLARGRLAGHHDPTGTCTRTAPNRRTHTTDFPRIHEHAA